MQIIVEVGIDPASYVKRPLQTHRCHSLRGALRRAASEKA
jgi:hypothetical protein